MIAFWREETGVLVMELSDHLWPDDLELVIPYLHDVSRVSKNPVLLLVGIATNFDTSPLDVLREILQPGILPQQRPSRIAVLTAIPLEALPKISSQQIPEVQIRFFSPDQRPEAKAWLLSFERPHSMPAIFG